jgi:hypothetical protein
MVATAVATDVAAVANIAPIHSHRNSDSSFAACKFLSFSVAMVVAAVETIANIFSQLSSILFFLHHKSLLIAVTHKILVAIC